ncbi:MAG TPA: hypothetical protein VMO17_24115, partial [Terriglobia bacterium]|nr:hypothetical protein [Terriglobia bacterium]
MKRTRVLAYLRTILPVLTSLILLAGTTRVYGGTLMPCAGSLDVSRFRLLVEPAKSGVLLPLQEINIVEAGEKLKYEPLHIPPAIRDKAKVAILFVAVPKAESMKGSKEKEDKGEKDDAEKKEGDIHVLEAKSASEAQEWDIPARSTVVGVVFGPHGLDVKKVSSMVIKNP